MAEESVSCLVESVVEMEGKSVGLMLCTVTIQKKGQGCPSYLFKNYSAAMLGKRTLEHGKVHECMDHVFRELNTTIISMSF